MSFLFSFIHIINFQNYRCTKMNHKNSSIAMILFFWSRIIILRKWYHFLPLLSPRLLDDVFVLLLLLLEDISTSSPFDDMFLCLDLLPWDSGRSSKSCWSCLSGTSRCFLLRFDPDETVEDPFWFDASESWNSKRWHYF